MSLSLSTTGTNVTTSLLLSTAEKSLESFSEANTVSKTSNNFSKSANATTRDTSTITSPYADADWILAEIILWVVFLPLVFILIGLIHYIATALKEPRHKCFKKRPMILFLLCNIAVVIAFIRNVTNHVVAFGGWQNSIVCNIAIRLSYGLYFFGMTIVFGFIWYRQAVFYNNPLLKQFLPSIIICGDWFVLALLLIGGIGLVIVFVVPQIAGFTFMATETGCRNSTLTSSSYIPKLLIYITVFFHIILLLFFLFPLLSSKTKPYSTGAAFDFDIDSSTETLVSAMEIVRKDTPPTPVNLNGKYNKAEEHAQLELRLEQGEKIITFIYKMCVLTLMCIGVDVAITSGQFLISAEPELIFLVLFDINLLVNIVAILSTFNEWLHMMFPLFCKRKKKRKPKKEESKKQPPKQVELPRMPEQVQIRISEPANEPKLPPTIETDFTATSVSKPGLSPKIVRSGSTF